MSISEGDEEWTKKREGKKWGVLVIQGQEKGGYEMGSFGNPGLRREGMKNEKLSGFKTVSNHLVILAQEVEVVYPQGENGHVYHKKLAVLKRIASDVIGVAYVWFWRGWRRYNRVGRKNMLHATSSSLEEMFAAHIAARDLECAEVSLSNLSVRDNFWHAEEDKGKQKCQGPKQGPLHCGYYVCLACWERTYKFISDHLKNLALNQLKFPSLPVLDLLVLMSQMIEPICHTHAKNATAHPGQIVLDAQQKHWTPKVKATDEKHLKAAQEAKEALAVAGLNWLAELITTRAQPAREDADEDFLAGDDDSGDDGRKKKGGKNAQSLSNAIVKACKNLSTAKADSHDQPRLPKMPEVTHLDELVGGFGDEDLDDSFEHAVALHNCGKVSTIKITSHDTDPDLMLPPLAQQQSQVNSARKRKQFVDITQGISEEDDLLSPQEEIDDIVYEPASDEEAMQVNEIEDVVKKPIAVKMQQANTMKVSRTTAVTSVSTVSHCDNNVPPSKKAKTTHVKSEHPASTTSARPKGDGNWVELVSKAHSTYLNTDLPPGCHEDGKWARQFLPMVFLWLSAQDELWTITDVKLLHACQEIFKVVFPNIQYKVVTSGSVFGVVTQCVSEWHSNFGSTALTMVIDFLNSNRDTSPQTLAKLFLDEFAFLYPDPENINKAETFHSAFVQELLATAHLAQIIGHADLKCTFTLVTNNTIVVDNPEAPVAGQRLI
ncbi:uncharacterized protein BJ212DRAFT_1299371 [Suillus subaureus]|uniref:Uncharacterized protein n=1 Tax=Suillus subaureus TaxID=48587 RepID=A0A9P7ECJ7_9AGAM|nr:uncharacterized protein BJ212DRAFT_1299371 [Suillus subaureus]KAG1817223.1 hypothetical protein BJ212DRAFT_1299371 [Suillus subaureus]